MASPWDPPKRPPVERPWVGMALLVAVPVLALILIRMLWSGSSLWFLTVGIILLGAAAVLYLVRRPQETPYDRRTLEEEESNRGPLILIGLGVLFLAMLLLPNFSGGGSGDEQTNVVTSEPPASDVADTTQPPAQLPPLDDSPPAVLDEPADGSPAASGEETYVVVSGDNLWEIAQRFGTTVDAILDANPLENPSELQVGDELLIVAAPAGAPVSPPAAVDEPVDDEPPSLSPGGSYVVVDGDNLWSIAGQFGVTIEAIVEANALEDPTSLQVGQELLIPESGPGDAEAAGE